MEASARGNVEKKKRKRGKTILDDFSNLISPQENLRVKSTVNLLRHLSSNDDEQKKYALTRTIRGLGSSNKNARCGFFTALIGILQVMNVSVQDVFDCIEKELRLSSGSSKGELADISAGRILTCGAIIRSKLWTNLNAEEKKKIVELLLESGKTRSYLTLLSYMFLMAAMEHEGSGKKLFSPVKQVLERPTKDWDMDTLFLWMGSNKIYKGFFRKDLDVEELCRILTVIPGVAHLNHPVYKSIYSLKIIDDGFITTLDNILINDPGRSKLLACIRIITSLLDNIQDHSIISSLISETFLERILDYSKKKKPLDPDFQKLTDEFFHALQRTFAKPEVTSDTKIKILQKFLFKDSPLLSKMTRWMVSGMDNGGVRSLADFLREAVTDSDFGFSNNDRLYAARLLVRLLNHRNVGPADRDWTVEQLEFLMDLGLFRMAGDGRSFGTELTAALKTTFFNALDLKSTNLEHLQFILKNLVMHLDRQLQFHTVDGKGSKLSLRISSDEEIYSTWVKTIKQIESIEGQKQKSPVNNVFLTLFLNMALQLFNDVKLATDSLEELFLCYEKSSKVKKNDALKKKSKKKTVVHDEDGEGPVWIEVVIDLFLNLLSRNSHLLRSVINSVFPHLRRHLTTSAIHQILSVLDPEQEGGNPLMAQVEDEEESDSEEGSGEEDVESDLDEKEEDEEEDEPGATEKLRLALHQVLSNDADDQESIDLDEMSDGEATRLDEALSEAFRLHHPRRSSKRPQKSDQALVHFRVRVLDLLDIYLDDSKTTPDESSVVSLEHVLEIVPVLLKAVAFTIKTDHQGPFRDRLRACLRRLPNLKKFRDSKVDGMEAARLLDEILGNSWNIARDMVEEVTLCSLFLIKYNGRDVENVLVKHLEDYFSKRDTGVPYSFFSRFLGHTTWEGLPVLIPVLVRHLFNPETKWFKRNQSAELLKLFYNNRRFLNEQIGPSLQETQQEFFQKVLEFLQNTQEVPDRFLTLLFDLLITIEKSPVKSFGIDWDKVKETIQGPVGNSKDVKGAYRKLCAKFGIQRGNKTSKRQKSENGVESGRKRSLENAVDADSVQGNENGGQKRKKKRKKVVALMN